MQFTDIISIAGYAIEAFGVLVVVVGSCISSVVFIRTYRNLPDGLAYKTYRRQLGRSIILGLEFLIAGDIVRTVVVSYSLEHVAILGLIILATAALFVPLHILHPWWMLTFLVLTAVTFSLFGFIIGIWADGFEKLQIVPMMIITPLTFLGGSFYSINMLPPLWQKITLFNPVVYLVSGFRWSFYGVADVGVAISLVAILGFLLLCLAVLWWIFRTGYRIKT